MKRVFDLNADLGELDSPAGRASDAAIMDVITSASIACGGHAGDADTMARAVDVAGAAGVAIGAHPSFPDRANFGRAVVQMDPVTLDDALRRQIETLAEIADRAGARLAYVKPHGALYNAAVTDRALADTVVGAIARIDPGLTFLGGPRSEMESAAKGALTFVREGFVDRRYTDGGHLQSRAVEGAVLTEPDAQLVQLDGLIDGEVRTATGKTLALDCRSLCLHGDTPGAMDAARAARDRLLARGAELAPFA